MRALAPVLAALLLAACQATGTEEAAPEATQAPDSITPDSELYVYGTSTVAVDTLPEPQVEEAAPAAGEAAPAPEGAGTAASEPATEAPARPAQPVPHIYMALQPEDPGKPVSVIFAIDAARDNTPSDDPAIRITPDGGSCNPQEMRFYEFPERYAARPVVSEIEQEQGLKVIDLPNFMAISVTNEMLNQGLAGKPEETRPQNVCTRKLWERLVLAENQPAAPAGQ